MYVCVMHMCKYIFACVASLVVQTVKNLPAMQETWVQSLDCSVGDLGSIPGLGRSPGGRHGNPLQYSCLENPHGQRSLAGYTAHEATKRWT